MHVPPSLQQLKAQARRAAAHCAHQTHRELEARKSRRPATPRADGALLQRVRLGYCTREELQEDFRGQVCDHCEMPTRRPLVHYLLSCPATPPEARPGPRRPACRWGLLSGREGRAALMVPPHPERRDVGGAASSAPSPLIHHVPTPCRARQAAAARADGHGPGRRAGQRVYFTDGSVDPIVAEQVPRFVTTVGQSCLGGRLTTAPLHTGWWPSSTPSNMPCTAGSNCGNTTPTPGRAAGPPTAASPRQQLVAQEGVSGSLIPSHVGSEVTRRRTRPPSEPPRPQRHHARASHLQQLKASETGRSTLRSPDTPRAGARKRQAAWYAAATDYTTHWTPPATTQGRWRTTAACASGLTAPERSYRGLRGAVCDHCEMYTRHPLVHYLLSCPATAPLRPGPAPAAQPAGGGLLSGREGRAALMVRHTPRDVMLGVLRAAPPPR
ncbi:hypothetical protein GWK47_032946 [Chionoecetes opilio]|uniref:Uncharacterized protein n=1 Tax=Chionoecetes opilio TaxID=41210 RepID=A0A8J4YYN1_CHIOP|nr:hypothetical protein GWK47_032946 [Chionoecetes opilio]